MLSIRRFSSLIINCSGNGRSLLSPLLPLRQPILRTAEESPEQRFVYRLAFDRVAEISEHCEHHNRQEHDHPEADPVLDRRVHVLHALQFGREVTGHQTDG